MPIICNLLLLFIFFCNTTKAYSIQPRSLNQDETFLSANFIEYDENEDLIYADGNVVIVLNDYIINAGNLLYDVENDRLWAENNVVIRDLKTNDVIYGEVVFLKDNLRNAIISDFILQFQNQSVLVGRLARRIDAQHINLYKSSFTPCVVPCDSNPIWQISAKKTYVNFQKQYIVYKHLFFEVYGVPILYIPYFSHPTPNAKAQSGILVPEIKNNAILIPIYVRAKPNIDFTFTPNVAFTDSLLEDSLLEAEMRHKTYNGAYQIQGSYTKNHYKTELNDAVIKDKRINRYHLSSIGNFNYNGDQYGFNINSTSDKGYLKNNYNRFDSYLVSNLYYNKVYDYNYFSLESLYFQGLKSEDTKYTDPLILPNIITKNVINLNHDIDVIITNNSMIYHKPVGKRFIRSSIGLSINDHIITDYGHVLQFTAKTREDIYVVEQSKNNNKLLDRNIPEINTTWRYPLINKNLNNQIIIEPIVTLIIGRKFRANDQKFLLVDTSQYELTEANFFETNHYSGIDYHEFGNRVLYGINSNILTRNTNYYNLFIGQFLSNDSAQFNTNKQILGKISTNIANQFEIFYKFNKDKHMQTDTIGFEVDYVNTQANIGFAQHKQYDDNLNNNTRQKHFKQLYYDLKYQLTDTISINHEMRVDISTRKTKTLYHSIKMTYFKDCVSMAAGINKDYTQDDTRGREKNINHTFSLGLKILNM